MIDYIYDTVRLGNFESGPGNDRPLHCCLRQEYLLVRVRLPSWYRRRHSLLSYRC